MANLKAVTDTTFEADVLKADGPVLVDFWAPWCGPCRAVAPVMQELAAKYAGKVTVVQLNTDENPQVSQAYGIRSIPTIALFSKGEVIDGVMGAAPLPFFTDMLDKHVPAAPATAGEPA